MNKVILISIDGMRPDGLTACGNPFVQELQKMATFCRDAQTIEPSVTFPSHISMTQSVPAARHGIQAYPDMGNDYVKPLRPVTGLFELLKKNEKSSAMFYGWGFIRELARPETADATEYMNMGKYENTDAILTQKALDFIKNYSPDFVMLYQGETDCRGHDSGWMSEAYLKTLSRAIDNVKRVIEQTKGEYSIVVTADHGGHDFDHGTLLPVDMTIPMFFYGKRFEAGKELHGVSILDISPTIADVMEIPAPSEWEGKSVLNG